jgi:hypothetical protein
MDPVDKTVSLWVSGVPRSWKRPTGARTDVWFPRRGRPPKVRCTDQRDQEWRNHIRAAWVERFGCLNWIGGVRLLVVVVSPWPMDWDNGAKGLCDALGATGWPDGLAPIYFDDKQVWDGHSLIVPAPSFCEAGAFVCAELSTWRPHWPSARRSR